MHVATTNSKLRTCIKRRTNESINTQTIRSYDVYGLRATGDTCKPHVALVAATTKQRWRHALLQETESLS